MNNFIQTKNGDYMKKIIIIFLVLLVFNFNCKTMSVFNEDSNFYILTISDNSVTTNNIDKYFNDIQVIWVIIDNKKYYYDENLKEKVIKDLLNNNLKMNAIKSKIDGAVISKIKVYCSNKKIENIKKVLKSVEISN